MKHLIGKKVYLEPMGNNARRSTKIVEAQVKSVARVFITLAVESSYGGSYDCKFRMEGDDNKVLKERGDCNAGYLLYELLSDIEDKKEAEKLAQSIANKFNYRSDWVGLELSKLKEVARILGLED